MIKVYNEIILFLSLSIVCRAQLENQLKDRPEHGEHEQNNCSSSKCLYNDIVISQTPSFYEQQQINLYRRIWEITKALLYACVCSVRLFFNPCCLYVCMCVEIKSGEAIAGRKRTVSASVSRSLGDSFAKIYGVIHTPEINCHQLTYDDLFLICATDGLWQVLDNQDCINAIATKMVRFCDENEIEGDILQGLSKKLVNEASVLWRDQYYDYNDDITVLLTRIGYRPREVDDGDDTAADTDTDDDEDGRDFV